MACDCGDNGSGMVSAMKKSVCFFEKPVDIYSLRKTYRDGVEFVTDTETYPMAVGIRYEGPLNKAIKGKLAGKSVKAKADRLVELYKRRLFRVWDDHTGDLVGKIASAGMGKDEEADKRKKRRVISEALGVLGALLAGSAMDFYRRAYMLGKDRGVSISGKDVKEVLSDSESQKLLGLTEKNKKYLDNFMRELEDKYVEAVQREYEDDTAREEEIRRITQANEARLSLYANAALGALAAGLVSGILEGRQAVRDEAEEIGVPLPPEITGIVWVTARDEAVCPGCADNDGKFFTMDEFLAEYQSNECLVKCRCAETSVPTTDPPENFARSMRLSNLRKGGQGSGSWEGPGQPRFAWTPSGDESVSEEIINAVPTKYERLGVTNGSPIVRSMLQHHKYALEVSTATLTPEQISEPKKYSIIPELKSRAKPTRLKAVSEFGGAKVTYRDPLTDPVNMAMEKFPESLQKDMTDKVDVIKYNGRLKATTARHKQTLNTVTGVLKTTIELSDDALTDPKTTELIMTHELSHALDYSYNKKVGSSLSDTKEFKEVMLGKGTAISKYALHSEKEFFAEHVVAYLHTPAKLKEINPGVYDYMEKLFAGTQTFTKRMEKGDSVEDSDVGSLMIDDDFKGSIIEVILRSMEKSVKKGGVGSGSWEGPGQPRFAWSPANEGGGGSSKESKPKKLYPMKNMIKDAKLSGIYHESSKDVPRGWLLPKGQGIITTPSYNDSEYVHKDTLQHMGRSWNDAMGEGLVRKASNDSFQLGMENQDAIDSVEVDIRVNYKIHRENLGGSIYIDVHAPDSEHPSTGKIAQSYKIPVDKLLSSGVNLRSLMTDEHMIKMEKGGPGSGCQGPNCGRPKGSIGDSSYMDRIKNSIKSRGTLYRSWSPSIVDDNFDEKTLGNISDELKSNGASSSYRFLYSPTQAKFAVLPWSAEHGTTFDDLKAKGELNGEIDKNWVRGIYTKKTEYPTINITYWGDEKEYEEGSSYKTYMDAVQNIIDNKGFSDDTYLETEEIFGGLKTARSLGEWREAIAAHKMEKGGAGSGSWEGPGQPRFAWTPEDSQSASLLVGKMNPEQKKVLSEAAKKHWNIEDIANPKSPEEARRIKYAADTIEQMSWHGPESEKEEHQGIWNSERIKALDDDLADFKLKETGEIVASKPAYFDDINNRTVDQVAGKLEVGGETVKIPEEHKLSESMVNMEVVSHDFMGNFERNPVSGTSTISKFVSEQIKQYPDHLQSMISKRLHDIYFVDNLPEGVAGRFLQGHVAGGGDPPREIGRIEMSEMIYQNAPSTKSRIDMMLTHELAHALDYSYKQEHGNLFSESKSWKEAMVDGQPISSYAKKNWRENFAESVTAYMYVPDHLKKASPKSYEVLDKLFKNVEGLEFVKRVSDKNEEVVISDDFKGSIIEILSGKLIEKGGTGSGCQGPNCGRPKGSALVRDFRPAINLGGRVYEGKTGQTHGDIMIENPEVEARLAEALPGFVDPEGRFYTRSQMHNLTSEDVRELQEKLDKFEKSRNK